MNLSGKDSVLVEVDGEEKTVYNAVSVSQLKEHLVHSVGGYETWTHTKIYPGDAGGGKSGGFAVTPRIAELVWHEFGVDEEALEETHDIDIIDPNSEGVTIL